MRVASGSGVHTLWVGCQWQSASAQNAPWFPNVALKAPQLLCWCLDVFKHAAASAAEACHVWCFLPPWQILGSCAIEVWTACGCAMDSCLITDVR